MVPSIPFRMFKMYRSALTRFTQYAFRLSKRTLIAFSEAHILMSLHQVRINLVTAGHLWITMHKLSIQPAWLLWTTLSLFIKSFMLNSIYDTLPFKYLQWAGPMQIPPCGLSPKQQCCRGLMAITYPLPPTCSFLHQNFPKTINTDIYLNLNKIFLYLLAENCWDNYYVKHWLKKLLGYNYFKIDCVAWKALIIEYGFCNYNASP